MRFLATLIVFSLSVNAQENLEVNIPAEAKWVDTGVKLARGDRYSIEVSGQIVLRGSNGEQQSTGPAGLARGFRDLLRALPLNTAGRGALIGKLGDRDTSQPFMVGVARDGEAMLPGNLFLSVNLTSNEKGEASFKAKIKVTRAPVEMTKVKAGPIVEVTQAQLDSLPTRVEDAEGTKGDRVNFLIVGSEAAVTGALKSAGWVQVDKTVKSSVINAILISMSKQAYLTIPMSELLMFDRSQDYGFAHAVPFVVVAQRHHFRIWRAPFQVNGNDVWVGAGTHDIGFEKDQRNGSITHKIDPDTDKEREYIGQTLEESGLVVKKSYLTHKNPVKEAKTAHGGSFHSDGRTLIVYLEQKRNEDAVRFANLFCSVLKTNPDGGEWDPCEEYIETKSEKEVELKPISRDYRLVVVPGIFSSCASDAPAFERGRAYLKDKHAIDTMLINIPNNSSEDNGKQIAKILREEWAKDKRKFILVGYSKGTPDIQTALATEADIRPMVAAFVSVAGASGGSPVADALPERLSGMLGKVNGKGGCQGDLSDGFKSLSVEKRRLFLAKYPKTYVPTFSIPAVADQDKVSKAMVQSWTIMNGFSPRNDAQLTEQDAIIPGSMYLGAARSDHFALALPLENMQGGMLKSFLDKNSYPRAALLESVLRFALEEIKAPAAKPVEATKPAPAKNKSIFQP
jgi:hypothetical protein